MLRVTECASCKIAQGPFDAAQQLRDSTDFVDTTRRMGWKKLFRGQEGKERVNVEDMLNAGFLGILAGQSN